MYIVLVQLRVKLEHVEDFLKFTLDNASSSRNEPGCLRFDVARHETEPDRFLFYEVYRSVDDFKAHQQTAHYLRWKESVPALLAEPRVGNRYAGVSPPDADW